MANSLLGTLLGSTPFKVKDEATDTILWSRLKVKKVEIGSDSSNADEPLSVQQTTDDSTYKALLIQDIATAKILRPSRIRVTAFADDITTIESVMAVFGDTTSTLLITSRALVADSMALIKFEIEQTPDMLSASKLVMEFEQVAVPSPSNYNPYQSADSEVYGVRVQSLPSLTKSVTSLYNKVSSFI